MGTLKSQEGKGPSQGHVTSIRVRSSDSLSSMYALPVAQGHCEVPSVPSTEVFGIML